MYDFDSNAWATQQDYPFHDEISAAPVVYFNSSFVIFAGYIAGGNPNYDTNVIARFNLGNKSWSKVGTVLRARAAHNAIQINNSQFLVVGGRDGNTEKCTFSDGTMTCEIQSPHLTDGNYWHYPELFPVSENYCT